MGNLFSSATGSTSIISVPRGLIDADGLFLLLHSKSNSTTTEDADLITEAIPADDPIAAFDGWKYSDHGKAINIIRSTSSITSTISSSIMIWMILRSHDSLSTTQHRLLLGLCISDFVHSLSQSTFNAMAPSELDYVLWNARGNQNTCTAQGFFVVLGLYSGLFYNASLNLYFLAVVKYKKSDEFIRAKIEPFLHGLPIAVSLTNSVTRIIMDHYNPTQFGDCVWFVNNAPHCDGYEVGEVPDEFEIPCYRGSKGSITMGIIRIVLLFIPIIIMVTSLMMIYRAVRTQEMKLSRYGLGALRTNLQQSATSTLPRDAQQQRSTGTLARIGMLLTAMKNFFKSGFTWSCKKNPNEPAIRSNDTQSQSRSVMHKALGYTSAWFLSYGTYLTALIIFLATSRFIFVLGYIATLFFPLQGLFNLFIFMYPKIMAAKKSKRGGETVSWFQAFSTAFWSKGKRRKKQGPRKKSNLRGDNQMSKKSTHNASRVDGMTTPALRAIKKNKKKRANDTPNEEEEKCEIQMLDSTTRALYAATSTTTTYAQNIATSTEQTSSSPHIDIRNE